MVTLYTLASLMGALLLFLIQPMFAKMTLPLLGGTPAVWNTAMVFYQVVLLLGYAYSHYSTQFLSIKKQSLLHMVILLGAALVLPISITEGISPATNATPAAWLLGIYTMSIGLPFFALSTMSPLLQKWFSQTDNVRSGNPYFLYAASNVGSIFALLAYPALIEPTLGLTSQGIVWSSLYGVFVVVILCCVWKLFTNFQGTTITAVDPVPTIHWQQRLKWAALAFVPSSLLLSVTSHLTMDLASTPFLWILPLSIFLLTFVIVFSRKPIIKHSWMVNSQAWLMLPFAVLFSFVFFDFRVNIPIHLLIFFISAMVCHGELAASKPDHRNLTMFYLFMSIGGALGGMFTALVAPVIFNSVYEYPIGLVLACLARPVLAKRKSGWFNNDFILPILIGVVAYSLFRYGLTSELPKKYNYMLMAGSYLMFAIIVFDFRSRPIRYAIGVAFLFIFGVTLESHNSPRLEYQRSFFAVHKILGDREQNYVFLKHGTSIHGIQSTNPARRQEPLSYFHKNGPAGQFFTELKSNPDTRNVGLVGLGLGALTCYKWPGHQWKIFEIDPVVVEIANNTQYFHFLEQCGQDIPVVLGDARLSLQNEKDGTFDVLILDAFSSLSIPIHLLTAEAIDLYMSKLSDHGVLLMHISNRFLDLAPVLAKHAENQGYFGRLQLYPGDPENFREDAKSYWVVLSQNESAGIVGTNSPGWGPLPDSRDTVLWTDDFSNLWQVIIWPD